jgi:hypothetical protein
MSNHTNRELYTEPNYIHRHVGGSIQPINRQDYVQSQLDLIQKSRDKLPLPPNQQFNMFNGDRNNIQSMGNNINQSPSRSMNMNQQTPRSMNQQTPKSTNKGLYFRPESNRFDPYIGFLHKKGLLDDGTNRRRFITTYIDINSAFRVKEPSLITEDAFVLENNPLDFQTNSSTVFVKHLGHNYEEGDLITMTGVVPNQTIIRTFNDDGTPTFLIPGGCNFMKVFVEHNLPLNYVGTNIEVAFEGIRGDRGAIATSSFLGSIPTNIINSRFPIRLTLSLNDLDPNCDPAPLLEENPEFFDPVENAFFVILPTAMHNPTSEAVYTLREYNYKVIFLSLSGIPINILNAAYPIGPARKQGFHVISDVVSNGYNITVNATAVFGNVNGGGSCVTVAKISAVNTGYPDPNKYNIDLGRVFHDVVSAKLVSLEFPNSEQAIKSIVGRSNNKIYWNDIDDGDLLYSIEVPTGNYTPQNLETLLESLFFDTARINSGENIGATYTPNHFVQVNIDTNTDITTFESFKEFVLSEPIDEVSPDISQDAGQDNNPPDTLYVLTIKHPGHGFATPGKTITISGAIAHLGIPLNTINAQHIVTEIVDSDTYKIQLPRTNLSDTRIDTKGGGNVTILIPDLFRMRFDQPDTLGQVLGFRNPGDSNSITPFTTIVSNNDPYEFDIDTNVLGEPIEISNNSIQLSGDNYVLMVARPLETLVSIGPIKSAFAKILLCDLPGKVLFNSYVNTSKFYNDPIHELFELEIEFFSPDGTLFDFNGIDHSFTIEIITVHDIPSGTGISANTGRNYNIAS